MTHSQTIPVEHWAKADVRLELLRKLDHEFNIIASKAGATNDLMKQIHSQTAYNNLMYCEKIEFWTAKRGDIVIKEFRDSYLRSLDRIIFHLEFFKMRRSKEKIESLRDYVEAKSA